MSSSHELDWEHADLPAFPTTTSGHKVQWQCWLGQKFECDLWIDFKPPDNWAIETSFTTGQQTDVILTVETDSWTIEFATMEQVNMQTLTRRRIRRTVIVMDQSVQQ